jgi:hypothetical protein
MTTKGISKTAYAGFSPEQLSNVVDRPDMIRRLPWVDCQLTE